MPISENNIVVNSKKYQLNFLKIKAIMVIQHKRLCREIQSPNFLPTDDGDQV